MVLPVQRSMWWFAAWCLTLPLWSLWSMPEVGMALKVFMAALLVLAALSPQAGLVVCAGVGPMAVPLVMRIGGGPLGGNAVLEAMVLAVVAGVAWRWGAVGALKAGRLGASSLAFGAAALASVVTPAGWPLWTHVTHEYFSQPRNVPPLHEVAVWVEALLLAVMIERVVRHAPKTGRHLALAAACGLAGESVFSALRLAQIAARSDDVVGALWQHGLSTRISPHFPDANAMGSQFALGAVSWFVVAVSKGVVRWERGVAGVGLVLVGTALWLTGSRAALGAAGVTAFVVWWQVRRPSVKVLCVAVAVVVTVGVSLAVTSMSLRPRATPSEAMNIRMALADVGMRMAADHPWFGVGLGEFSRRSAEYISPQLIARFPAAVYGENAHNQLIQIAAEVGVIGLVVFVWYWIRVLGPAIRCVRAGKSNTWLSALTAGLVAFHLSALLGHPFLTPYVVFCVFVSVGVVAGLSQSDHESCRV